MNLPGKVVVENSPNPSGAHTGAGPVKELLPPPGLRKKLAWGEYGKKQAAANFRPNARSSRKSSRRADVLRAGSNPLALMYLVWAKYCLSAFI